MTLTLWTLAACGVFGIGDGGGGTGAGGTGPTGGANPPAGLVDADGDGATSEVDCADGDPAIHPGAAEACNGVDDDCDGLADDLDPDVSLGLLPYLVDADADGFGGAEVVLACVPPSNVAAIGGDCDDADASVHPNAAEVCDLGDRDEDCDTLADDLDPSVASSGFVPWFSDADGDGYGPLGGIPELRCDGAAHASALVDGDCDDGVPSVNPAATERCDIADLDEDCDGLVEAADPSLDLGTLVTFYVDVDADGYGDPTRSKQGCDPNGAYVVANGDDCDDDRDDVSPVGTETCDEDDTDEDCDTLSDDDDSDVLEGSLLKWYADDDGDGFGGPDFTLSCDPIPAYAASESLDCDDGNPDVSPDETEVCGDPGDVDEDCDGLAQACSVPGRIDVPGAIDIADVAVLLDVTGSMAGKLDVVTDRAPDLAAEFMAAGSDVTLGVASFADYNMAPFGELDDKPFTLVHAQTTDDVSVGIALGFLDFSAGGDTQEAGLEALTQLATGLGYDQNCSGSYNSNDDVRPFVADVGDAFGGTELGLYDPAVPGTGILGGLGFREDTLPLVIVATDAEWRDSAVDSSPGGCPGDASFGSTVGELNAFGARVLYVNDALPFFEPFLQHLDMADRTEAWMDPDGDGVAAPHVVSTFAAGDWDSALVSAVDLMFNTLLLPEVTLEVASDPEGVILDLGGVVAGKTAADTLSFDVVTVGPLVGGPGAGVVSADIHVVLDGRFTIRRVTVYVDAS